MAADSTKFLHGAGTKADPYLIHNTEAWQEFIYNWYYTTSCFKLVSDIDASSVPGRYMGYNKESNHKFKADLYGSGRKVYGINPHCFEFYSNYTRCWFADIGGRIENIHFVFSGNSNGIGGLSCRQQDLLWNLKDVIFEFTGAAKTIRMYSDDAQGRGTWDRVLLIYAEATINVRFFGNSYFDDNTSRTESYVYAATGYANTWPDNIIQLSSLEQAMAVETWKNFSPSRWVIDGCSFPRLVKEPVSGLITAWCVKGVTKVGGVPKQRRCSIHSNVDLNLYSSVLSNQSTGEYVLYCGLYSDHVYVTHRDDYGSQFSPSKFYSVGEIIHPSIPNGYRYVCTTAGTSAATEPTNWPQSGTLISGSAIFTALPVYKPELFVAVPVLIDMITGQPV